MREVPEGWVLTTLGESFQWASGGTPRKAVPEYYDGGIPWAVIGDLNDGLVEATHSSISEEGLANSSAKWVAPGAVLLAMYGSIGKLGISATRLTTNQAIAYTQPEPVLAGYLFWYLRHIRSDLSGRGKGGTQRNISQTVIKAVPFPLAPLAEQRRILARIEALLSELDDGVTALKRAEANLERYRASVLKAAVEGRLTEQWRSGHPPDETGEELLRRILAERRKRWEEEQLAAFAAKGRKPPRNWKSKYREPLAPDTSDLPALPEGWCWATVDQITAGDRSCAYGVLKPGREVLDGIPLVRVGNIKNGRVSGVLKRIAPGIASKYRRTLLRGGELLITLVGAIGRTAVAPRAAAGANTARAVGVVPVSSLLDAHWPEVWFRSPLERHRMVGKAHEVARKTLNLEDVRSAPVALPPLSEQAAILLGVSRAERQATAASEAVEQAKNSLQALRQSILKRAFEGRLVPQDPDDEPASVLLERIRTAREA